MNWLAHLYLSGPNPAVRIGNLLPDIVRAPALVSLSEDFQRGIRMHHRIDAFTDQHPVVRQSFRRFPSSCRRFAPIFIDLFYDHFLARDWDSYSREPFSDFTSNIYRSFVTHRDQLPSEATLRLDQMRRADWLTSYREVSGIAHATRRIALRFQRPVDLSPGIVVFQDDYESFRGDFLNFFPDLQRHVSEWKEIEDECQLRSLSSGNRDSRL